VLSNSSVLKLKCYYTLVNFHTRECVVSTYVHYRIETSDFTVIWVLCGARKEEHSSSRAEGLKTTREATIRYNICNFSHLPFSQSYVRKNIFNVATFI